MFPEKNQKSSRDIFKRIGFLVLLVAAIALPTRAQTTAFTYQGKLTDGSAQAAGNYDLQFALFDSGSNGNQIGSTIIRPNVPVSGGIFTVVLDFGSSPNPFALGIPNLYLQISVKHPAETDYTTLAPRQFITSAPFANQALNAATATNAAQAAQANNAANFAGLPLSQFVQTNDSRLSDARTPTAGSANYIQANPPTQQAATNFNISGSGTVGGTLSATVLNASDQIKINGIRVFNTSGTENTFVGQNAGIANNALNGQQNTFVGNGAGQANSTGSFNSFLGRFAGSNNQQGGHNTFVGTGTGNNNINGNENSYFGSYAGAGNENANHNAFFGYFSGYSNVADANSFFGESSGFNTNSGGGNSFFGEKSGYSNTSGAFNSFFGIGAGYSNTTADRNSFFGVDAGRLNASGTANAFFGDSAGYNTNGAGFLGNSFFGHYSGYNNDAGTYNTFIGVLSGYGTSSGGFNTFIGGNAGNANTVGTSNAALGYGADVGANNLNHATAIGADASVAQNNSVVLGRTVDFVGVGTSAPKSRLEVANGDVYVSNFNNGIILKAPNGGCWRVTVGNTGTLTTTGVACP